MFKCFRSIKGKLKMLWKLNLFSRPKMYETNVWPNSWKTLVDEGEENILGKIMSKLDNISPNGLRKKCVRPAKGFSGLKKTQSNKNNLDLSFVGIQIILRPGSKNKFPSYSIFTFEFTFWLSQWLTKSSKVWSTSSLTFCVFIFSVTRSVMMESILRFSFCTVFSPYSPRPSALFRRSSRILI